MKNFFVKLILILVTISTVSCSSEIITLQGAGASFPAPLYTKLFADYTQKYKTQVTYQAVGSGSGIQSIKNGIVDFGATDAFISDTQLVTQKENNIEILHIPAALAAVNFTYNLPSLKNSNTLLSLDSDLIFKIYNGDITNWNDNQIKILNPTITFPELAITPVFRSDSSGTTFTVSEFMSKANQDWADTFGIGKTINWITGIGQKGNSAMMSFTKDNIGSISYVDYVYAVQNNFPVAKIKNKSGNFVIGDISHTEFAAAGTIIPKDTRISITYGTNQNAAPMATFSYLLIRKEQNYNKKRTLAQAQELVKLLQWMYSSEAQTKHPYLEFTPLPLNVITLGQDIIKKITFDGKPVVDTLVK